MTRRRATWVLAAVVAVATVVGFRESATVLVGQVVDLSNLQFVQGATVSLAVASSTAETDAEGHFQLDDVDLSTLDTLLVNHPDYRPLRIPLGSILDDRLEVRVQIIPRSGANAARRP